MNKFAQIELAQFSNAVELIYQGAIESCAWNIAIPVLTDYMQPLHLI